jgi:hypothetical protein
MKITLNRLGRKERGQALPLALCFLVIGGMTITTLLTFMSNGLKTGQLYEEKTKLHYAADAGLEEVLWKMQSEQVPIECGDYETEFNYALPDGVNEKAVDINIKQIWPLTGLESDENGTTAPSSLTITGGIIDKAEGKYKVQISYDGTQGNLPIDRVAVWLPTRFQYVAGSSSGITTQNPTITNQRGGKVLTWDFSPAVDFLDLPAPPVGGGGFLPGAEYPATRKLYFNVTPVDDKAGGSYSWVRTTDESLYLAWETGCSIFQVSSTATDNITGKSITLGGYTYLSEGLALGEGGCQVRGNYRAIGDTLMVVSEGGNPKIRDTLFSESSANVTNIPADAEVVLAYLYWSGWRDYEGTMEADTEVGFKVNGHQVYFDGDGEPVEGAQDITASKYWLLENNPPDYSYSCFKDVTELVKLINPQGSGTYTVSGVDGDTGSEWSYAGWSLMLFYSSPSEQIYQLFLYDHFLFAGSYSSHTFTIGGFETPPDAEAVVTCFVGEGDEHYGWPHWGTGYDYLQFNGYYLSDAVNPQYNVWNGKSSGLGGQIIDGVDIDSFNVSSPIIYPGDTSAQVRLGTGIDNWNLIYILLSFRTEYGALTPNATGFISYTYGGL